jgi:hypothetical protein
MSASGSPSSAPNQSPLEESDGASDISMDEDQSSREPSQNPTLNREAAHINHNSSEMASAGDERECSANPNILQSIPHSERGEEQGNLSPNSSGNDDPADTNASPHLGIAEQLSVTGGEETAKSDDDAQVDLDKVQQNVPVEPESESLSPAQPNLAGGHLSADKDTGGVSNTEQLDQISSVGQPREDVQEIENVQRIEGVSTEVNVVSFLSVGLF